MVCFFPVIVLAKYSFQGRAISLKDFESGSESIALGVPFRFRHERSEHGVSLVFMLIQVLEAGLQIVVLGGKLKLLHEHFPDVIGHHLLIKEYQGTLEGIFIDSPA